MNKINIYNETKEQFMYKKLLTKLIKYAFKLEKLKNTNCNIIIVNDEYIHELNKNYRKKDKPTDVITFALEDEDKCILPEGKRVLGDIYISIDRAKVQAEEYNHSLKREISFLAVHGFYHLLGYDHQTKEEEKEMFEKQEEVLNKYGITKLS